MLRWSMVLLVVVPVYLGCMGGKQVTGYVGKTCRFHFSMLAAQLVHSWRRPGCAQLILRIGTHLAVLVAAVAQEVDKCLVYCRLTWF